MLGQCYSPCRQGLCPARPPWLRCCLICTLQVNCNLNDIDIVQMARSTFLRIAAVAFLTRALYWSAAVLTQYCMQTHRLHTSSFSSLVLTVCVSGKLLLQTLDMHMPFQCHLRPSLRTTRCSWHQWLQPPCFGAVLCVLNGQTTPCRVKGASPKRQSIHG